MRGARNFSLLVMGLLLLGAARAQSQAQAGGLPGPERLEELRGRPSTILYSADPLPSDAEGRWIATEAELEVVLEGRLEDLVSLLRDFEGSPEVFSRIEEVKVRSREGEVVFTEQRSAVRVFGLAFISNLVFRSELEREAPGRVSLSFEMVGGDGSSRKTLGGWELEAVELPTGPAVYLRYRCSMIVENRFPLQLEIMRLFGKGDFERTVGELGKAFAKRQGNR